MTFTCPNHPFVVWGSCFLWLTSMFAIIWSLLLFFCIGDMLLLTGTDLINAIVLLSGIIMLPTNVFILCAIAHGRTIDHKSKVICCPLWLCMLWVIAINCVGAALCIHKMTICKVATAKRINSTIKHYRTIPKYKYFIDNLQWSLKCCGLNSYTDWFDNNWYDITRDYEWDLPEKNLHTRSFDDQRTVADSVPLSCCKSGSCISNYLLELGTSSINTRGCGDLMHHIILSSMATHLIMFLSVIVVEAMVLNYIIPAKDKKLNKRPSFIRTEYSRAASHNIKHIMSIKDNFSASSASLEINPDDSDDYERIEGGATTPRQVSRQHSRMDYK